jgi:ferredoxin
MKISRIRAVFFSPTGTTEDVVRAMVRAGGAVPVEMIDITTPASRKRRLEVRDDELLIAGAPVYMGRVPSLTREFFASLKADNSPAVPVVVYGNRAFENSLLELSDMLKERGCVIAGAAAFVGEHSFSSAERPIASGRPDQDDLALAGEFGRLLMEKLISASSAGAIGSGPVPGVRPYGGTTQIWDEDFIALKDSCRQCGLCASVCPAGAVDPGNAAAVDTVKCVTCCACIKKCPARAKEMKPGKVMEASVRLNSLFSEPKKSIYFI